VALTRAEIHDLVRLGVPAERIDVVPPGILESAFEPGDRDGFRARHGLEGDVVMFLARLGHDKGLGDLVAAMPHVLRDHPRAVLAVCGPDGGARASAEAATRRLGIADRVRFVGRVPVTRDAYAACDVFVHPSHYESFGLVIIEAQAQGRPVVTTSAGGCPEAAGDVGVIVPPREPAALAREISALLGDPERRRLLGERGRERARGYLWPSVVEQLMEVTYHRALVG
jgi:phosphatidylinositol alpha-1,6-mannosyltransferase